MSNNKNLNTRPKLTLPSLLMSYFAVHRLVRVLSFLLLTINCFANQPLISDISASSINSEDCCFQLTYNYDGALGDITSLETQILAPNVLFSSVYFPLGNGWSFEELQASRRFRWSHNSGSIPLGENTLADLCFSGWNTSAPVELLIIWRQGNSIRQRDTIRMECNQCWQAQNNVVECQADSSYSYTFDYTNLSAFEVDHLQIRETSGQDLIVEQNIPLAQSLQPGQSITGLQLNFRPETVNLSELCFEITPRHFRQNGISIECCTAEYCVLIPICDRCCTDYFMFEQEVHQGFTMLVNCENNSVRLQANALNECDEVLFQITGLGSGIVRGNETVGFGNLQDDQTYEVTMTATRQDMQGMNCYEESSLLIVDSFFIDCDSCFSIENVNLDASCNSIPDFVCGCDGMTYLNECAAENWGGLTAWSSDSICAGNMPDSILLCTMYDSIAGMVLNEWQVHSTLNLQYLLVQTRSINPIGDWTTLAQLDPTEISYIDNNPTSFLGHYRILGVAENGKVIFSVDDSDTGCLLNNVATLTILQGGKLWPNPANQELNIVLPIRKEHFFEIWSSTGQRLHQAQTNYQGKAQIPTDQWSSGYYYIMAYIDQQTIWRKPFIINHY